MANLHYLTTVSQHLLHLSQNPEKDFGTGSVKELSDSIARSLSEYATAGVFRKITLQDGVWPLYIYKMPHDEVWYDIPDTHEDFLWWVNEYDLDPALFNVPANQAELEAYWASIGC